jgi:hypothetical protein
VEETVGGGDISHNNTTIVWILNIEK